MEFYTFCKLQGSDPEDKVIGGCSKVKDDEER